jgi:enoyl-CoA hydratase
MELALSCDLIVANSGAKFGIPEAKRGLAAAAGGLIKLPRQMPWRVAMELALTGDFMDAQRAYELGFINRVVDGPSLEGAKELARKVAANGPLALIASKRVLRESHTWSNEEMWGKQAEILGNLFATNDAREGAAAFAEKRKPNWTGT